MLTCMFYFCKTLVIILYNFLWLIVINFSFFFYITNKTLFTLLQIWHRYTVNTNAQVTFCIHQKCFLFQTRHQSHTFTSIKAAFFPKFTLNTFFFVYSNKHSVSNKKRRFNGVTKTCKTNVIHTQHTVCCHTQRVNKKYEVIHTLVTQVCLHKFKSLTKLIKVRTKTSTQSYWYFE